MSPGLRVRSTVSGGHSARGEGVRHRALGGLLAPRHRRQDRHGIAILMVLGTLMFLTVLVTDIGFGGRVRFLTAMHERDEQKAYWLSVTGINVYRLVLTANAAIANNSAFRSAMEMAGIAGGDALWQMIPFVNTGLLRMLSADSSPDEEELEEFAQTGEVSEEAREESREQGSTRFGNKNFLDFDGDFSASVRGEDCRFNVNDLAKISTSESWQESGVALQLYGLFSGEENEQFLRERNLERWDLIGNLKDWVDTDNVVSSGKGGYEDDFYNTRESPYLAKNAPLDTLQEIRLVEGWQDHVYDRFAEQLTIYGSGQVNINCADDEVLAGLIKAYGGGARSDSEIQNLLTTMRSYMYITQFKSGKELVSWLEDNGLTPTSGLADRIGTKTTVFTVTSTGQVGDTTVTITSVLNFKENPVGGAVKYWRVD